jgi:hypothetical protein
MGNSVVNFLAVGALCIIIAQNSKHKSSWLGVFVGLTKNAEFKYLSSFTAVSDQFSYRPSLLNAPDLPPWIHYVYSDRHQTGFLYGVPPQQHGDLEVIVLFMFDYCSHM